MTVRPSSLKRSPDKEGTEQKQKQTLAYVCSTLGNSSFSWMKNHKSENPAALLCKLLGNMIFGGYGDSSIKKKPCPLL